MPVAVIPARGGSKRIPRKNIRRFHGRPMIAHAIRAAQAATAIDRIIVSTDDEEVAAVAEAHGAEVPFRRPAHLADDHATLLDVMMHAMGWLTGQGLGEAPVCLIFATAPFLDPADLDRGLAVLRDTGADYCLGVLPFPAPVQRALKVRPDGRMAMVWPENVAVRSQDLEPYYYDAGQFSWAQPAAIRAGKPALGPGTAPLVLPAWRAMDIDTEEDWQRAERLFALLQSGP